MYYLWLLVFPTASKIVKYFDYFAERHPDSASLLSFFGNIPILVVVHSVSLLPFASETVSLFLLVGMGFPTSMVGAFFFFRGTRFLPTRRLPFLSDDARTSFPDFGTYIPEQDPEISFLGRFVLRHPDFTLLCLMFWLLPFHLILRQIIFSAGLEENAVLVSISALISILAAMISVVLFFKAFRLIVHAEGGMGGMSGKAYR